MLIALLCLAALVNTLLIALFLPAAYRFLRDELKAHYYRRRPRA